MERIYELYVLYLLKKHTYDILEPKYYYTAIELLLMVEGRILKEIMKEYNISYE